MVVTALVYGESVWSDFLRRRIRLTVLAGMLVLRSIAALDGRRLFHGERLAEKKRSASATITEKD